jgi:hypothetical protein
MLLPVLKLIPAPFKFVVWMAESFARIVEKNIEIRVRSGEHSNSWLNLSEDYIRKVIQLYWMQMLNSAKKIACSSFSAQKEILHPYNSMQTTASLPSRQLSN